MKKVIYLILIFILLVFLFDYFNKDEKKEKIVNKYNNGVFISYIDYSSLNGKDEKAQKKMIDEMIRNVAEFHLDTIILQVRSFSDAIYESNLYKSSHVVVKNEGDKLNFDILDYFIKKGKEYNIDIYAWINPYRIRNTNSLDDVNKDNYYYKWIGTNKIEISENGIYLNPADEEVLDFILKGVEEVLSYDIKAVIYDDYFYPDKTIDLENYESTDKSISIEKYRIDNINKLIKKTHDLVNGKGKEFGISPAGNIENNLKEEYLDVEYLLDKNYIDFVIPQLYYGFNNTSKPYVGTLNIWNNLSNKDYKLYVALSLYKSGSIDKYALDGKNEWVENTDIIKREVEEAMKVSKYKGFYIFRYENLFSSSNDNMKEEVKNLKDLIYNT